jgi:hypothetical protein
MMWMLVAAVVAVGAVAIVFAIVRLGHEIPRAVEALDAFGREMRPALIRVSAATEDVRARTTRR